jgi:hypothetical protein
VVVRLPAIGSAGTPQWSWAVGPWTGLPTIALSHAVSRSMKFVLRGTSSASFTMDGTAYEAGQISELVSDLWVTRNGQCLLRGRVGPTSDDNDGSKHSVSFSAGDYRSLLERRQLWDSDPLTYTAQDRADIAWNLIATTQGQPGGDLGITRGGAGQIGMSSTITYQAGQSIGQAVTALALMDSGFDWDITPYIGSTGMTFDVWPVRGTSRGRALNFPGNIAKWTRQFDPGTYANAIRETGNTGLAAARVEATDIATRPEGRWDAQLGDTGLLDAGSVASRAAKDLTDRQTPTPVYTLTLRPGEWGGPADIWLGDTVIVDIDSGRISTQGAQYRVMEIDVDLDENDNETVKIVTGVLDPSRRFSAASMLQRLTTLERR